MNHLLFLAAKTLIFRRGSFALLLIAITGALGLQISNTANLEGYSQELLSKGVILAAGHLVVSAKEPGSMAGRRQLLSRVDRPALIQATAPRYSQPAVLFFRGTHQPINAVGVTAAEEERGNGFCSRLLTGQCFSAASAEELILGNELAEELHLSVGAKVLLVIPFEDLDSVRYVKQRFRVVGVMAPSGGFSAVERGVFVPLDALCTLLEARDSWTSLHLYLRNGENAEPLASLFQKELGPDLVVRPWTQVNSGIASAIESNRSVNHISQTMVILAILIPTLALLWISVLREQRQIAALEAIGFTRQALFVVYLLRAGLVGLLGAGLGLATGLLLCRWFQSHPIYQHAGFVILPVLNPTSVALSVGLALGVTVLGGLAPAVQAAFSNPALNMRNN